MDKSIVSLKTNCAPSSETYKEAYDQGLILYYGLIKYRGYDVQFLSDLEGVHCCACWNGQIIDLGLNNIYYKEDACRFIDRQLDLITTFPEFPELSGAQLEWFNNEGYRDIRLKYRGRIIKVFLVVGNVNETFLISESRNMLLQSGLLENKNF